MEFKCSSAQVLLIFAVKGAVGGQNAFSSQLFRSEFFSHALHFVFLCIFLCLQTTQQALRSDFGARKQRPLACTLNPDAQGQDYLPKDTKTTMIFGEIREKA